MKDQLKQVYVCAYGGGEEGGVIKILLLYTYIFYLYFLFPSLSLGLLLSKLGHIESRLVLWVVVHFVSVHAHPF